MWTRAGLSLLAGLLVVALAAPIVHAQSNFAPSDVTSRRAIVMSEGIALAATVYQHPSHAGKPRPTIILCHGWGGEMAGLKRTAAAFAAAGYTAITFDYRGWGESAGRLILSKPQEPRRDAKPFNAEVVELRQIVHPWEHVEDITSVLAWAVAQPEVDVIKLGLWGTSYGGGHVLFVAAYDARIKVVVAQVASFDSRRAGPALDTWRAYATRRAKGEVPYPPPQPRTPGKLHGHPMLEHMLYYAPVEQAGLIRADQAVLIIAAENEELMDNRQHGQRVHERLQGPKSYVVIPGITHYDVYGKAFDQAIKPAVDWYDKYLK
ncbi:MAG: alpha/beta hydrolase [Candidatus Rokuibacteriota bacterium]